MKCESSSVHESVNTKNLSVLQTGVWALKFSSVNNICNTRDNYTTTDVLYCPVYQCNLATIKVLFTQQFIYRVYFHYKQGGNECNHYKKSNFSVPPKMKCSYFTNKISNLTLTTEGQTLLYKVSIKNQSVYQQTAPQTHSRNVSKWCS